MKIFKDESKFYDIVAIISIIGAVIIPVMFVIFNPMAEEKSHFNSIVIGLLATLICFLLFIVTEFIKLQKNVLQQDEHHNSIKKALIPRQFQPFFQNDDDINNEIIKNILPKYIDNFSISNDVLKMQGGMWAIECYNEFWNALVNRQKTNKRNSINVFAVDFSYARIQKEKEYITALNQAVTYQKEFIENNGRITRVFLGTDKNPDPKLISLFSEMLKNDNYEAYYLNSTAFDLSDSEDFLIVPGHYSCRWYYTNKAKTPNQVSISSIDDLYLKRRLDEILELAKNESGINLKTYKNG
jgi:hypothetical protein